MTREIAKRIVKGITDKIECNTADIDDWAEFWGFTREEYEEFLDMAIKALEQKPCNDAISRQDVLNTLDSTDKFLDETRTVESYKTLLEECYKNLPSVTPTKCIATVKFSKEDLQEIVQMEKERVSES